MIGGMTVLAMAAVVLGYAESLAGVLSAVAFISATWIFCTDNRNVAKALQVEPNEGAHQIEVLH